MSFRDLIPNPPWDLGVEWHVSSEQDEFFLCLYARSKTNTNHTQSLCLSSKFHGMTHVRSRIITNHTQTLAFPFHSTSDLSQIMMMACSWMLWHIVCIDDMAWSSSKQTHLKTGDYHRMYCHILNNKTFCKFNCCRIGVNDKIRKKSQWCCFQRP